MSKPRIALTVVSGLLAAGLGLGALAHVAAQKKAKPAPTTRPEYVPGSASLIGFVDIQGLVASPLFEIVTERQAATGREPFEALEKELKLDPRTDLTSATFSVEAGQAESAESNGSDPPTRWGWAVRGSYDGKALEERIASRDGVRVEEYGKGKLYLFDGDKEGPLAFALPEAQVFLFGEPDYVRDMIDVGAGGSVAAARTLAEWQDALSPVDTFWIAGRPPSGLDRLAGTSAPGLSGPLPELASIALSGRLSQQLSLVAQARSAEPAGASSLAELVRGLLALGRLNNGAMGPELRELLDTVHVEQAGDRVAVSLDASFDVLKGLLDRGHSASAGR